jgi:hypothetical protein
MDLALHKQCSLARLWGVPATALMCAAAAIAAAPAETPQAVLVAAPPLAAQLTAAAEGQLTLRAGEKTQTLPAAALVVWGRFIEPAKGPLVLLADGGLLAADVFSADKDRITLDGDTFSAQRLPLEALAGVVFQPPARPLDRDLLVDRVLAATGDDDRLLLDNGDQLAGLLEGIADDVLTFRAAVGEVRLPVARVVALALNPALRRKPQRDGPWAWAGFSDGSRLPATDLRLDAKSAQFSTAGQTWKAAPGRLAALQPVGGRAVYLSDLKPESYRHTPFLELSWPYRADRNVLGGWLRAGGQPHVKGLGLHSAAQLVYALDQPYRRFAAEVAVDDAAAGEGSVRFRVLVDGRERFTSPTLRGGDPPVPVAVELDGGKRLELLVDFADRADVLDYADWLNARLEK